jgi:hypothetical protein
MPEVQRWSGTECIHHYRAVRATNRGYPRRRGDTLATTTDAAGIAPVCATGWRDTYRTLLNESTVEDTILRYYNVDRITTEIASAGERDSWLGWVVAADGRSVVGAAGGGLISESTGQVFVVYVLPKHQGMPASR